MFWPAIHQSSIIKQLIRKVSHLLNPQPLTLQLVPEALHVILQPAAFISERDEIRSKPIGRIVVCRIEAFVQELQLRAEVGDVRVKVLEE